MTCNRNIKGAPSMNKIKTAIDAVLRLASIFLLGITSLLVIYQVATRYLLNKPSSWSESVITYGFIWLVMLCGAYVFGQREHMNMTFVIEKFSKKIQILLELISELFIAFLAVFPMIMGGYTGAMGQMHQLEPSTKIPMGIIYMVIPIAGFCILFYCVNNSVKAISEWKSLKSTK